MNRRTALRVDVLWDVVAPVLLAPVLLGGPRGHGTVVVIPGWRTTDTATVPLRAYLGYLGHDVHGWGHGANRGGADAVRAAVTLVRRLGFEHPVSLVGWSLGGAVAWEVARRHPDLVAQVVTLRAPIAGLGHLAVPATSIWSRTDTVVSWRASRVPPASGRTNVEVHGSHVGLGHNPTVLHAVAAALSSRRPSAAVDVGRRWRACYPTPDQVAP